MQNTVVTFQPWREVLANEDGKTFYVNEYTQDAEGTTRRNTIIDGISQGLAAHIASMPSGSHLPPILYARREPTLDTRSRQLMCPDSSPRCKTLDVVLYKANNPTQPYARYPWWSELIPTRRNKWLNLNSVNWRLEWLESAAA